LRFALKVFMLKAPGKASLQNDGTKNLSKLSKAAPRQSRTMSALPARLRMEPGKLGKRRMSFGDDAVRLPDGLTAAFDDRRNVSTVLKYQCLILNLIE
jgi:hypothetical protein